MYIISQMSLFKAVIFTLLFRIFKTMKTCIRFIFFESHQDRVLNCHMRLVNSNLFFTFYYFDPSKKCISFGKGTIRLINFQESRPRMICTKKL